MPAAGGSIAVDLSFRHGSPLYEASSGEGGFLTVPSSSSTSFTVTYPQNTAFAPRVDTLIITPTDDAFDLPPLRRIVIQHGTASAILGDVQLNSLEDITPEIRAAQYIMGNLTIGDSEAGNDITNTELARLQVEEIRDDLLIQGTKLTSLSAFSSLRRVGGDLSIGGRNSSDGNAMLESISGLNALEHVGGGLVVRHNNALTTATGFERLDSIGGILRISSHDALTSLPDFRRLRIVGGRLSISENVALTSLPAFPALISIGSEAAPSDIPIQINFNDMLATCCGVFPFAQSPLPDGLRLGGDGQLFIGGNMAGCNSEAEVREATRCPLTLIDNIALNSLGDITTEIRNATRIVGNLSVGDAETGTDITNTELARLNLQALTGNLTSQAPNSPNSTPLTRSEA